MLSGPSYMLNVSELTLLPSAASVTPVTPSADAVRERRMRWLEVVVVTSVAFTSPVLGAVYSHFLGRTNSNSSTQFGLLMALIGRLPSLLLLAYVLWRSGRTFKDIGLRWSWKDAGVGVPLVLVAYLFQRYEHNLMYKFLWAIGDKETVNSSAALIRGYWAQTPYLSPVGLVYQVVNAIHEEVLVRAYLMTEIIDLTGSAKIAVIASVLLQTSYHIYYGWLGAFAVGCAFLIFALYFAWARKGLPCVVAHWLMDMVAVMYRH
jgi:membrane protease YdiL (CAAX protease family)